MSEHLRALIVILGLALPVFWVAQRVLCPKMIDVSDLVRRRNLWLGITIAAFLTHNYWLFLGIALILVLWGSSSKREKNPIALYLFLLFAIPPFEGTLPGFGVIEHLFDINHSRLLGLLILLPLAVRLSRTQDRLKWGEFGSDWFMLGYLVLNVAINFGVSTATHTMRGSFYLMVDTLIPYYVASRSIRNVAMFRDAIASMVAGLLVIALIAVFEFGKHWLLYAPLGTALGLNLGGVHYLARESLLRAVGPTGQSIVLGYLLVVAMGLWHGFAHEVSRSAWYAAILLLAGGLIASLSRGPWVGALAVVVVFAATGRQAGSRVTKLALAGGLGAVLLMLTPYADRVIDFLPFVGTVDAGNVTYRAMLYEVSMSVISQNPFFGSPIFLSNPVMEQMRQGDGIIDLVNSYLAITLYSGFVGLIAFCGIFAASLVRLYLATRVAGLKWPEVEPMGRALLAALVGALLIIATVSSIFTVSLIYWILAGLAGAYAEMVRTATTHVKSQRDEERRLHGRSVQQLRVSGARSASGDRS